MIVRYGKESAGYLKTKQLFYDLAINASYIAERERLDRLYLRQPRRTACKNCDGPLSEVSFTLIGVDFLICPRCGHLNGAHEDTREYCEAVYTEADHSTEIYGDKDVDAYMSRSDTIYRPKVEFMLEALRDDGIDPTTLRYADLGAGSGHLVAAMLRSGLEAVEGFEVSPAQVSLANDMCGREVLHRVDLDETVALASRLKADVVTMVFSLEHFEQPREIMRALKANPSVRYIFLALPMFSPGTITEISFSRVMTRQLGLGHTHLYTVSSLEWLIGEHGLRTIGEWWFGSDIFDLHRSVAVTLKQAGTMDALVERWSEMILPSLDEMQASIDRRKLSSESHLMLSIGRRTGDSGNG